jgi:hypothetical protein
MLGNGHIDREAVGTVAKAQPREPLNRRYGNTAHD